MCTISPLALGGPSVHVDLSWFYGRIRIHHPPAGGVTAYAIPAVKTRGIDVCTTSPAPEPMTCEDGGAPMATAGAPSCGGGEGATLKLCATESGRAGSGESLRQPLGSQGEEGIK